MIGILGTMVGRMVTTLIIGVVMGCGLTFHLMGQARERASTRALMIVLEAERNAARKAADIERRYRARLDANRRDADRLRAAVDAGRLRDTGTRCSSSGGTVGAEGCAAGRQLSDEVARFLESEARRADELHSWAMACKEYVDGL